jgi:hypothetical protein
MHASVASAMAIVAGPGTTSDQRVPLMTDCPLAVRRSPFASLPC